MCESYAREKNPQDNKPVDHETIVINIKDDCTQNIDLETKGGVQQTMDGSRLFGNDVTQDEFVVNNQNVIVGAVVLNGERKSIK